MSSIIVVQVILHTLFDFFLRKFESTEDIDLKILSKRKNLSLFFCLFLYLSFAIPLFWKRFEVGLNETEIFWRTNFNFKIKTFCMMNLEEKICRKYQTEVRCFDEIPETLEFDGSFDEKSCSVIFPPGFSIYIEEFIIDDPGPDNFVLIDGLSQKYNSKLKWEDREQPFWRNLQKNNSLSMKWNRRSNLPCVKKLKVT